MPLTTSTSKISAASSLASIDDDSSSSSRSVSATQLSRSSSLSSTNSNNNKKDSKTKKKSKAKKPKNNNSNNSSNTTRKGGGKAREKSDRCWNLRYEELREFYRQYGHSDVPAPYEANPSLSRWVKRQRWEYALLNPSNVVPDSAKGMKMMSKERIIKLMLLDFTWNIHEQTWERAYTSLLEFKSRYGHTNVPFDYHEDLHLAQWVRHQRLQIRRYYFSVIGDPDGNGSKDNKIKPHHITLDRIQRLYDVGFTCKSIDVATVLNHKDIMCYPEQKILTLPDSSKRKSCEVVINLQSTTAPRKKAKKTSSPSSSTTVSATASRSMKKVRSSSTTTTATDLPFANALLSLQQSF